MSNETKTHPLTQAIADLGITLKAEFVPFSRSRNAKPSPKLIERSLNWRYTLYKDKRPFLTSDYSAGIGHCPSHKTQLGQVSVDESEAIIYETEHGKVAPRSRLYEYGKPGKPIEPNLTDVIYGLVSEAEVIDYATFEDWADVWDVDKDSRQGEKDYRAMLEVALKLRAGLGEDGLQKLREAAQGY